MLTEQAILHFLYRLSLNTRLVIKVVSKKNGVNEMKMKFNWKVVVVLVVLFGTIIWGITSLSPLSYSGTNVEFSTGNGSVWVTNPSDKSLPVEIVGTGTRSFTFSNITLDTSSSSIREGTGRAATQSFVFSLPPGSSEFTIVGGNNVNFLSNSDTRLEASVSPVTADEFRDQLILIAVIILGLLFFLSSMNDHRWISASRRQKAQEQAAAQEANAQTFKRIFGK